MSWRYVQYTHSQMWAPSWGTVRGVHNSFCKHVNRGCITFHIQGRPEFVTLSDIEWVYMYERRGPTASRCKFKHGWAEYSTVCSVSCSSGALKPSRLDNELIKDRPNWLWACPTSTSHHSHDEFSLAFHLFHRSSASVYNVLLSIQTEEQM